MLGALIPLQHHAVAGIGKILDHDLLARSFEEVCSGGCHRERTPGKLIAVIVDDDGMLPVAEVAPVRVAEESIIPVIVADPDGVGTGQPIRRGNRVSIVEADGDVPLGLTFPARDDSDTRHGSPVAGNPKGTGELGVSQGRNQDNEPKAKTKQESRQHLLIDRPGCCQLSNCHRHSW